MRNKINSPKGFTFVEALITFSIVAIFLALTWATISFLLMKTGDQIVRTRAHFLAVEGVEIVKQMRQTAVNRNRETGFLDALGKKEGRFVIKKDGDEFNLKSGAYELIAMADEPYIDYCRSIELDGQKNNLKKVTATVWWGNSDCKPTEQLIRYSTYLGDLKK